jgi:hypothetical protein
MIVRGRKEVESRILREGYYVDDMGVFDEI